MDHDGLDEDHDGWGEEDLEDVHGGEDLDEKMADEQDVLDGAWEDLDEDEQDVLDGVWMDQDEVEVEQWVQVWLEKLVE